MKTAVDCLKTLAQYNALGDGRFEALYHGGVMVSKFITFTVIK